MSASIGEIYINRRSFLYSAKFQLSALALLALAASEEQDSEDRSSMISLMESVPGIPGSDYPILSSVPETAFTCSSFTKGV